jgi:hypothetical protein
MVKTARFWRTGTTAVVSEGDIIICGLKTAALYSRGK